MCANPCPSVRYPIVRADYVIENELEIRKYLAVFDHKLLVPIPIEVLRAESTAYEVGSEEVVQFLCLSFIPDLGDESADQLFVEAASMVMCLQV